MVTPESDRLPAALVNDLTNAGYRLRKPITDDQLHRLTTAAGTLPEGVRRYLATSDGLDHPRLFGIHGSQDMLDPYPSNSLLPLRSDGCGNYDSIIVEPGPGFGAVVFWDHETTRAEYLMASSVPSYLELLLVDVPVSERWSSGGHDQNAFLRAHDAEATRLLDDPSFQAWIGARGPAFTVVRPTPPAPGEPLPEGARVGINPLTKERVVLMPAPKYRTPPR